MKIKKCIMILSLLMAGITPAKADELYICQNCPTGYWSDGYFKECKNCLTTGVAACSSTTGKATSCKPGYGYSNGSCSICAAGTYSAGGTAGCSPCPAGKYQNLSGQSSCKSCSSMGSRYYNSSTGQKTCQSCPENSSKKLCSGTSSRSCTKYVTESVKRDDGSHCSRCVSNGTEKKSCDYSKTEYTTYTLNSARTSCTKSTSTSGSCSCSPPSCSSGCTPGYSSC